MKRSFLAAGILIVFLLPVAAFWRGWVQFYRMADLQVMTPTVRPGDGLLVETLSASPRPGDLIVFTSHGISGLISEDHPARTIYLQRLVAVSGDEISFQGGRLQVNGSDWEPAHWMGKIEPGPFLREDVVKIVPEGKWFVLADNYPEARDSRHWGWVPVENYTGRVLHVFSRK